MSLPADDLLSAFHDGNISASEQATVERRLTLASAARQELSEIRQVSALLKDLPRETLPPEFPQQVLAAIEREMLIPSRRADRDVDVTPRQRWVIGGAAVLTSAAGLLLMLNVFNHGSTVGPQMAARAGGGSEYRIARTEIAAGGLAGDSPRRDEAADRSLAMSAPTSTVSESDGVAAKVLSASRGFGGNSTPAGTSGVNRVDANLADANSPNTPSARTSEFFFDRSAFQSAQIGEVVEALRTEGDQVAVVRLTVIDRKEGLKELQLLLAKSQIEVAESSDEAEKRSESVLAKKADKADRPQDAALVTSLPAAPDQLLAVFVESDADQLTAALQELREANNVESLEVESPILVAQLDDVGIAPPAAAVADKSEATTRERRNSVKEVKEQLALIDALTQAKRSMSPRRGISPESADRKKPDSPKVANKPAEATTREPQPGDKAKSSASSARQFAMQVPVQSLPQLEQTPESRTQSFGAARAKQSARGRQSGAVVDSTATNSTRPMQVLFVVVDQTQASQSASPAAAPKAKVPVKARTTPARPESPDGAA